MPAPQVVIPAIMTPHRHRTKILPARSPIRSYPFTCIGLLSAIFIRIRHLRRTCSSELCVLYSDTAKSCMLYMGLWCNRTTRQSSFRIVRGGTGWIGCLRHDCDAFKFVELAVESCNPGSVVTARGSDDRSVGKAELGAGLVAKRFQCIDEKF